jgi:hypothetical protein
METEYIPAYYNDHLIGYGDTNTEGKFTLREYFPDKLSLIRGIHSPLRFYVLNKKAHLIG